MTTGEDFDPATTKATDIGINPTGATPQQPLEHYEALRDSPAHLDNRSAKSVGIDPSGAQPHEPLEHYTARTDAPITRDDFDRSMVTPKRP